MFVDIRVPSIGVSGYSGIRVLGVVGCHDLVTVVSLVPFSLRLPSAFLVPENLDLTGVGRGSYSSSSASRRVERSKKIEDKLRDELALSRRNKEGLKRELEEAKGSMTRMASSTQKLDRMLNVGKNPCDKRGLGFEDGKEISTSNKTVFVKSLGNKEASPLQTPSKKIDLGQCSNSAQVKVAPRRSMIEKKKNKAMMHVPTKEKIDLHDPRTSRAYVPKTTRKENVVPSGCSRHMTGNKSFFETLVMEEGGYVTFGRKPNVSYFHSFGSKRYILNDHDQLGKFDAKSDEGIFIGYTLDSRAYKVFNLKTKSVMESLNVVIDDERLKSSIHEEEITRIDDSPLEKVVVNPNVGTSNVIDDDTQPIDRVPLLNSKELAPWVRQLHDKNDIIGKVNKGVKTRHQIVNLISYTCYTSQIEPEKIDEALNDEFLVLAMQEKLN
ncbi:hypothetical protein Q3G72_032340 [Acer saccharum]|nr:hypothetical protein Q3G72_032340 [Acer saccharum]